MKKIRATDAAKLATERDHIRKGLYQEDFVKRAFEAIEKASSNGDFECCIDVPREYKQIVISELEFHGYKCLFYDNGYGTKLDIWWDGRIRFLARYWKHIFALVVLLLFILFGYLPH